MTVAVLYLVAGHVDDLVLGLFEVQASLAYGRDTWLDVLLGHFRRWGSALYSGSDRDWIATAFFVVVLTASPLQFRWRELLTRDLPLLAATGACTLSILQSGKPHLHHLIQLLPLVSVLGATGVGRMCRRLRRPITLQAAVLSLSLLLTATELRSSWRHILRTIQSGSSATDEDKVARLIEGDSRGEVLVMAPPRRQQVWWYLDHPPPTRIPHLSNLDKPSIIRPMSEAGYIVAQERERLLSMPFDYVVVWHLEGGYLDDLGRLNPRNFFLWRSVGRFHVFKALRSPQGKSCRSALRPPDREGASPSTRKVVGRLASSSELP